MKTYSIFDAPIKVFGVPFFDEKKKLERLPEEIRREIPHINYRGRGCSGARVGFRTNAQQFTVKVTLETLGVGPGSCLMGCQSFPVTIGDRVNAVYAGAAYANDYNMKVFETSFTKSNELEDVTVWFLRSEVVANIEIILPDDAIVEAPTPYKYGKVLYYGSSITEGVRSSVPINCYNALLSRWLDLDYYNLGFAGCAKGELILADYINTIDMCAFVYDYDHNAPDVEHLEKTHEPFFLRIREKHPDIPVLMLSKPDFDFDPDAPKRREVIKRTYQNAIDAGDKNVYFIDGQTLYGNEDRQLCTVDRTHPNDLGFYRMAKTILPVMKKMLNIK